MAQAGDLVLVNGALCGIYEQLASAQHFSQVLVMLNDVIASLLSIALGRRLICMKKPSKSFLSFWNVAGAQSEWHHLLFV